MGFWNTLPRALAVAGALVFVTGCRTVEAPAEADVYHGFTLIDPATERRVEDAWIVIEEGRLSSIGSGKPPTAKSIAHMHDLKGRFVLPGFIDAHAHITATGMQKVEVHEGVPTITMESDDRITQHNARMALACGVTTIRNPGGDPVANARYDRKVAAGEWIGPEAVHAGEVIQPPPFSGSMFAYPRSEAEWHAEAKRQVDLGMSYLKLYVGLSEAELATGIRVAHEHGLKAIAHLHLVSWTRAADLGIDGLEHALPTSPDLLEPNVRAQYIAELGMDSKFMYRWFELADYEGPLIRELLTALKNKKVATNMTLVVNQLVYNIDRIEDFITQDEMRDPLPEVLEVYMPQLRASAAGWTPEDFQRARAVMPKVLAFARLLHEAGVPMMIGTDAGGGTFYARELALHREAGIPVWAVLRMATSGAAGILGMGNRIGRFKAGYEADLTILEADPLADVRAASRVYGVVSNGRLLTAAELRGGLIRQNHARQFSVESDELREGAR